MMDWKLLFEICNGGPVIKREYVNSSSGLKLELHPFFLEASLITKYIYI